MPTPLVCYSPGSEGEVTYQGEPDMSPMLRSVTTFALVSLFIAGWGVIGSGSDDDDDDRDKVECGYNAQPDGDGDCECVTRYEWCGEGTDDCCA